MQQRLRRSVQARAAEPPSEPQPTGTPTATADEQQQGAPAAQVGAPAPVQAGPRGARKAGKQQQQQQQRREQRREPRPIPIKGMVTKQQQQQQLAPGEVRWDDNKLLPEGWEEMDVPTKVYQFYMGRRGVLYWLSQAAWYGSIALAGAWILFRFVGPAIGLYTLKGDLLPTMM